ncbi:MAG TPA: DNA ligase, partial [bacterium]|nr:DNA ligase [bacterium]
MSAPFRGFAEVADGILQARGTLAKRRWVAEYLKSLDDVDLPIACHYLAGSPFPRNEDRTLNVGGATIKQAILALSDWDEQIYAWVHRVEGDSGSTAQKLVRNPDDAPGMSLQDMQAALEELAVLRGQKKLPLIREILGRLTPLEVKYAVKLMAGSMRIGLQMGLLEAGVAQAFGAKLEEVRHANMLSGDIGRVALAARRGELGGVALSLFQPLHFMLAEPLQEGALPPAGEWLVEDKFDGIRVQAHVAGGRVTLFSRTLDEVTGQFPELIPDLASLPGRWIIDGEAVGWKDGAVLHFNQLQTRLGRKAVSQQLLGEVPIAFIPYDCLYYGDQLLFHQPLHERQALLGTLPRRPRIVPSQVRPLGDPTRIEALFQEARARGNEGLMLKERNSLYHPGKRGKQWLKVKRAFASFDVVITAAEIGHGKRSGVLSDYTFAVRDGDQLVNIGKAYSGLTDVEIAELTRILQRITVQRYGRVRLVEPRVVLEVACDGIQVSKRHKSGFALRFPRILRWRTDKRPEEIDTLEVVRAA